MACSPASCFELSFGGCFNGDDPGLFVFSSSLLSYSPFFFCFFASFFFLFLFWGADATVWPPRISALQAKAESGQRCRKDQAVSRVSQRNARACRALVYTCKVHPRLLTLTRLAAAARTMRRRPHDLCYPITPSAVSWVSVDVLQLADLNCTAKKQL